MPFIHHENREINCKIVYWGPGLSGKTTNMRFIHDRTHPAARGALLSTATATERTLSVDLLPRTLPEVRGFRVRLHLHTVPGPVFYDASRVLVLKDVDGVVFVADSQRAREEANVEMIELLETTLAGHGRDIHRLPLVFQYNKRDAPDLSTPAELDALLDVRDAPRFEAIAVQGVGVFDTLKAVALRILAELREGS